MISGQAYLESLQKTEQEKIAKLNVSDYTLTYPDFTYLIIPGSPNQKRHRRGLDSRDLHQHRGLSRGEEHGQIPRCHFPVL